MRAAQRGGETGACARPSITVQGQQRGATRLLLLLRMQPPWCVYCDPYPSRGKQSRRDPSRRDSAANSGKGPSTPSKRSEHVPQRERSVSWPDTGGIPSQAAERSTVSQNIQHLEIISVHDEPDLHRNDQYRNNPLQNKKCRLHLEAS